MWIHIPGAFTDDLSGLLFTSMRSSLLRVRGHNEVAGALRMSIRLTKRDLMILKKCISARWLSTSQIQQLFFPDATHNAVQKRLRKLGLVEYIFSHQASSMVEAIHTVGRSGKEVLEEDGLSVQLVRKPPVQLEHFLGINDIRVQIESGKVPVKFFFAAWELASVGWKYPVIPDAVFRIELEGTLTFLVEYDRGTEALDIFAKKLRVYQEHLYGFPFDSVLIIGEGSRRIKNISFRLRRRLITPGKFFGSLILDIREKGLFTEVFSDLAVSGAKAQKFLDLVERP